MAQSLPETSHVTKKELIELLLVSANGPKNQLMKLKDKLMNAGLLKKASDLNTIIGELEYWQNH